MKWLEKRRGPGRYTGLDTAVFDSIMLGTAKNGYVVNLCLTSFGVPIGTRGADLTVHGEDRGMLVRVIYTDQTAGVVESHLLDGLIKKGRIVAYHNADRWIPVELKTSSSGAGISGVQVFGEDPQSKKLQ